MIGLYNKVYEGLEDGNPALTRLPGIRDRNTNQEVAKLVQGHLHGWLTYYGIETRHG